MQAAGNIIHKYADGHDIDNGVMQHSAIVCTYSCSWTVHSWLPGPH